MKQTIAFLLLLLLISSFPLSYAATSTMETWYIRSDTDTVNGVLGYVANTTQSTSSVSINTTTLFPSVEFGWRIWHVGGGNNETTEITSGTPIAIVQRSSTSSGIQSNTWTPPATSLQVGWDSFKFTIYYTSPIGFTPWTAFAVLTSERQMYKALEAQELTFYLWTSFTINTFPTPNDIQIRFGSSTYNTRIEDLTFTNPYEQEIQLYHLTNQDFIAFLFHPYVSVMGSLTYGILMLVPTISLYKRTKSFQHILILFVLFGGSTGVMTLMIPEIGMSIGWAFLLLGLGGLLYKTFR